MRRRVTVRFRVSRTVRRWYITQSVAADGLTTNRTRVAHYGRFLRDNNIIYTSSRHGSTKSVDTPTVNDRGRDSGWIWRLFRETIVKRAVTTGRNY